MWFNSTRTVPGLANGQRFVEPTVLHPQFVHQSQRLSSEIAEFGVASLGFQLGDDNNGDHYIVFRRTSPVLVGSDRSTDVSRRKVLREFDCTPSPRRTGTELTGHCPACNQNARGRRGVVGADTPRQSPVNAMITTAINVITGRSSDVSPTTIAPRLHATGKAISARHLNRYSGTLWIALAVTYRAASRNGPVAAITAVLC